MARNCHIEEMPGRKTESMNARSFQVIPNGFKTFGFGFSPRRFLRIAATGHSSFKLETKRFSVRNKRHDDLENELIERHVRASQNIFASSIPL